MVDVSMEYLRDKDKTIEELRGQITGQEQHIAALEKTIGQSSTAGFDGGKVSGVHRRSSQSCPTRSQL